MNIKRMAQYRYKVSNSGSFLTLLVCNLSQLMLLEAYLSRKQKCQSGVFSESICEPSVRHRKVFS